MAISGAMAANSCDMMRPTMTLTNHQGVASTWRLLSTSKWRPSEKKAIYTRCGRRRSSMEAFVLDTLTSLPNVSLSSLPDISINGSACSPRLTPGSSRASSQDPARKTTDAPIAGTCEATVTSTGEQTGIQGCVGSASLQHDLPANDVKAKTGTVVAVATASVATALALLWLGPTRKRMG